MSLIATSALWHCTLARWKSIIILATLVALTLVIYYSDSLLQLRLLKLINDTSVPHYRLTVGLFSEDRRPTEQNENLRRRIYSNTKELWYYISHQLRINSNKSLKPEQQQAMLQEIADRKRSLLSDQEKLPALDGYEEWRRKEAASVSDLVQRRLRYLQNPSDCRNARKLVCGHDCCGFGCDHHHLVYCLTFAYATRRTLIVQHSHWSYDSKTDWSWTNVFRNLSETCTSVYNDTIVTFTGSYKYKVLYLQNYVTAFKQGVLNFKPFYLPKDLVLRIVRFNGDPTSWWIGQMLHYIQKLRNHVQAVINFNITDMHIMRPIVGVHVRRTDKIGREAEYHDISEYMSHVEDYYAQLELTRAVDVRRVYLATDDARVFRRARLRYPQYSFYGKFLIARSAALGSRYTLKALSGLLVDLQLLSLCDYVVITFSSNIGRLVYEMMQVNRVDASNSVYSIDHGYFYTITDPCYRTAVMRHQGGPRGIALSMGDLINSTCWNCSSNGTILKTNLSGRVPWYKTAEYLVVHPFPEYKEVPLNPEPRRNAT